MDRTAGGDGSDGEDDAMQSRGPRRVDDSHATGDSGDEAEVDEKQTGLVDTLGPLRAIDDGYRWV